MDRAAFLRSLPYLQQLDPEIWAAATTNGSGNDESQVYSGSTVTPPTPSKHKSLLLFEESAVVSIEPKSNVFYGKSNNVANDEVDGKRTDVDAPALCRKRGRTDHGVDALASASAPAFFQQYKSDMEETNSVEESMEIDLQRINKDPALCSFEAAIVRHNPNPLGEENCNDDDGSITSWLLFRFGCRFVYLVDTNSIINVTYEPSVDKKDVNEKSKDAIQSPPMKKQKKNAGVEGENAKAIQTASEEEVRPPDSLIVSFPFCSFRLFSLTNKGIDESAQEGTNGTRSFLLKTISAEEKLLKARSMLMKHFALDEARSASREMMSPGLPGTIQHGFEDEAAIVNSSIPSLFISKSHNYTKEDWSFCLDVNKTLHGASPPSSPQKNTTPSKIDGSSSFKDSSSSSFENGQKVSVPENEILEPSEEDKGRANPDGADSESGGIVKETHTNEDDDLKEGDKGTDGRMKDDEHAGDEALSPIVKKGKHNTDTEIDDVEHSWKHDLLNKRCSFDASWSSVQKTMHNKTTIQAQKAQGISHLTRAAKSLSSSYLTPKERFDTSSQCENDIEAATKGIEQEIERIFPGRLSRKSAGNIDLGNFKEKIERLMRLRRESVDAKLALILTPKRYSYS